MKTILAFALALLPRGQASYTKRNIFRPLGMKNTAWHLRDISTRIVQPNNYTHRHTTPSHTYTFTDDPNGGLRSTARDLHTFLSTLLNGGLLAPGTIHQMTTPQMPSIDRDVGRGRFIMNRRLGLGVSGN